MPTCVGLRYGRTLVWREAFLGGLGPRDFCPLAQARAWGHDTGIWICLDASLPSSSQPCPFGWFALPTASPLCSFDPVRCRIISPACHRLRLLRPRLRSRLTLGCLTVPRNPQAFGVCGSHTDCATHSGIRSCARSTCPPGQASPLAQRSPTIPSSRMAFTASVLDLSLVTLSVPLHSTSELLRTLSMMAASKPTSWLSGRTNSL